MSRIEPSSTSPLVCTPEPDQPHSPTTAAHASHAAATGHVVDRFDADRAMAERARAAADFGLGEQAVLNELLTLGKDDFTIIQLRGFVKAQAAVDADARLIVRHEDDHTWTVELVGKAFIGAGETTSGAEAAVGGEVATKLRFQSPEGAADFLQAVATAPVPLLGSPKRVAEAFSSYFESARFGGLLKLEVGSKQHGLGKELGMLAKLGGEVEGGFAVTVDRSRGELVLEGKVEGLSLAQVNAPWAQLAAVGAQVKVEAKLEHRVKVDAQAIDDILHNRRSAAELVAGGETVLKIESVVEGSAVATVAGVGGLVKTEAEIHLGALDELTPERLGHAIAHGEMRAQVFKSEQTDIGGAMFDLHAFGGGLGWRKHREVYDYRATLGEIARAATQLLSGDAEPRLSDLDAHAAAARMRQ
ncbi:MAG: hypothetical protein AB1730_27280 [Myxococcota bacterium]|jgi:hypothetical protein